MKQSQKLARKLAEIALQEAKLSDAATWRYCHVFLSQHRAKRGKPRYDPKIKKENREESL